jgi:hypothetical protein
MKTRKNLRLRNRLQRVLGNESIVDHSLTRC